VTVIQHATTTTTFHQNYKFSVFPILGIACQQANYLSTTNKMGRKKGIGQRRKKSTGTGTGSNKQQPTAERIIPNNLQLLYPSPDVDSAVVDGEEEERAMTVAEFLSRKDEVCEPTLDPTARRIAIAFIFESLGAPEDTKEDPWSAQGDQHCLSAKVKQILKLSQWAEITTIFQDYLDCKASGIKYTGARNNQQGVSIGRPPFLSTESIEAQICADTQEEGFSVTLTWHAINQHRRESCMPSVTKSVVKGLIQQLKPKISWVRKVSQGNRDPNSHWAVARWLFSTQFLIRLGIIESQEITLINKEDGLERTFIPDYWDKKQLTAIKLSQIAWWDETHRKCTIGGLSGAKEYFLKFPRNESGSFDPKGSYSTELVTQLKVKYCQEARLCLGVVALPKFNSPSNGIDNNETELVGKRLKPFVYSGKVILSISDWKKKEAAEIRRIKNLQRNPSWVLSIRPINSLYLDDGVHRVKSVGKSTATKLATAGINIVEDLINILDLSLSGVAEKSGLSVTKIKSIRTIAIANVIHDRAPQEVDYRLAEDPYLAKFGPERRRIEISKSLLLSGNVCITDMITHLYEESEAIFKGTIHQNDWFFWHDALSLMTAKDTINWMKENGYYDRWLLPELDLYRDFPDVKSKYDRRPIGDTPESMPLDNNLNKDLHDDVDRQVAATKMLDEDNLKKFSMSTPKRATSTYLRVWESVGPTPRRIVQDVSKVIPSWQDIRANRGGYVDRIVRKGKRDDNQRSSSEKKKKHGGARKRKQPFDDYGDARLHLDAQETLAKKLQDTRNLEAAKTDPESDTRVSECDEHVVLKI
jgi:hypothetical protein